MANAIVGSLMMVGFATLVSTPIGILAGIYLAEFGDTSKTAEITRFMTDIMLSAPSIVLGLFVYAILVAQVKHFSGWAGTLALALIAIPVVLRTTENMLRLVPGSLREAAFALGAPRWKVTTQVTLRAAKSGVVTGVLLAQQVQGGVETILGVSRDPVWGPIVMFGLGGVFVEVLKDVTFRRAPFGRAEARRMIREVKGYAMLQGVRGAPPSDEDAMVEALTRLSAFAASQADALESIDINPFIVLRKGEGALAVDALIETRRS